MCTEPPWSCHLVQAVPNLKTGSEVPFFSKNAFKKSALQQPARSLQTAGLQLIEAECDAVTTQSQMVTIQLLRSLLSQRSSLAAKWVIVAWLARNTQCPAA